MSNANSENISQKCENISQKCENTSHIQERLESKTPLPPSDSDKKDDSNSGKSHKLEGLKKRITAKKLQDFIKVFAAINPDKESQRRWYGAMAKLVSMVEQDPRMMRTFPEESARLEKTDVVLSRTFKHFEQSGNPPQWPGYLFGVGFNVVSDFITLVADREKPIERPEPPEEISEEERKRRIANIQNVRKELGFDDEVVIEEEEDTEPKEPRIKIAEVLSLELMPVADGLTKHLSLIHI